MLETVLVARAAAKHLKKSLRPVQLATVLLTLHASLTGQRRLLQMKTGEGKTIACAAIAAALAKRRPDAAVHVTTSNSDLAKEAVNQTKASACIAIGQLHVVFVPPLRIIVLIIEGMMMMMMMMMIISTIHAQH